MPARPGYLQLHESGELAGRIAAAREILRDCTLCPRNCHVNRLQRERGACRTGALPVVASYGPHFCEERPLVGQHGSGTIFLAGCNLQCVFCQNDDISQGDAGREITLRRRRHGAKPFGTRPTDEYLGFDPLWKVAGSRGAQSGWCNFRDDSRI